MANNFAKKASATDTLKEMQQELDVTLAELKDDDGSAMQSQVNCISSLAAASPLAMVHIGPSASSKLNYIISKVIQKYFNQL